MEKRLLILSCTILFVLSIGLGWVFIFHPNIHNVMIAVFDWGGASPQQDVSNMLKENLTITDNSGKTHDIRMLLPKGTRKKNIEISDDFHAKTVTVSIPKVNKYYCQEYPFLARAERVDSILFSVDNKTGVLQFSLKNPCISEVLFEGENLYLDFKRPKEAYKYVLVLDAGHGGEDPGTMSGSVAEKDINLTVVNNTIDVLTGIGDDVGVFTTRLSDVTMEPKERAEFVNEIEADLFISIHQNSTASGRESDISGTEVMYFTQDKSGRSKELASRLSAALEKHIASKNRGILAGDDIFILRHINAPCALIELGFMSNKAELRKISSKDYQIKAGEAIKEVVREWFDENTDSDGQ